MSREALRYKGRVTGKRREAGISAVTRLSYSPKVSPTLDTRHSEFSHPVALGTRHLNILLDDVGFGAISAFGEPCQTPNLDEPAAGGLRCVKSTIERSLAA